MIDPRRAYEIFAAALDRAGEDRDAFVAAACGDDAALRDEVNNLLRVALDESVPALLLSGEAVAEPPSQVGQQFSHFRLIERIGIGGMGIVYRAERIDGVPQSVAIKLLIGEMAGPDFDEIPARSADTRPPRAPGRGAPDRHRYAEWPDVDCDRVRARHPHRCVLRPAKSADSASACSC